MSSAEHTETFPAPWAADDQHAGGVDALLDETTIGLDDGTPGDGAAEELGGESYADDDFGLWPGDRGTLDRTQRDTVVALMKKAFISSDDRAEWATLRRSPDPIAATLNNLYLKLVVDERAEVAYTTPARTADDPFKTLVRDAPNSREETLLLLFLREQYRSSTAAGQTSPFVDATAMYEYVQRFRPASATDRVLDERRVTTAIKSLAGTGLLEATRDPNRFRIHRAIEALLPLDRLNQLLDAFTELNQGTTGPAAETTYTGRHAAPEPAEDDREDESIGEFA